MFPTVTIRRGVRRLTVASLVLAVLVAAMWAGPLSADDADANEARTNIAVSPRSERMVRDRAVEHMLREISTDRLRASVTALVGFGTRNTLSSQTDPERGIGAARDWIYDQFAEIAETAGGRMTVELQTFTQTIAGQQVPISNVVATLRGTQDPDRLYLFTAHYDSRCSGTNDGTCDAPGANDDASGVAAVIEIARVMATRQFDSTVVFMPVAGEEQGLYGSTYFAEQAVAEELDIHAVLNLDAVGNSLGGSGLSEPRAVRVFSEGVPWDESSSDASRRRTVGGENDGPSRQLARYINTVGDTYTPDFRAWMVNRQDRFGRGGDHRPFIQRGFTAVRFTETFENYSQQHQTPRVVGGVVFGDLLEFVDFDYLTRVTRLAAAAAASLANAPAVPENARIFTGGGTNAYNTQVRWNTGSEPDLAGYEVVWRDSTSAVWTDYQPFPVGDRGEVVDLSKDNTMVGVRAVDIYGNKSPVALAR